MANPNVGGVLDRIRAGSKVIQGDHWIWQGNTDKDGYGRFSIGDKTTRVIRAGWDAAHPDRPLGAADTVDHLCRVESCVNPAHMEPVSRGVNASREDHARAGHVVQGQMHTDPALVLGYHGHRPSSNASGSGAKVMAKPAAKPAAKPKPKAFGNRFNLDQEDESAEGANDSPSEETAERKPQPPPHRGFPPSKGSGKRPPPQKGAAGQKAALMQMLAKARGR